MFGGEGDDLLRVGRFDPDQFVPPGFVLELDGGRGVDTLDLAIRPTFDLTGAATGNIQGIEKVELTGGGVPNAVTVDAAGVLNVSSETHTLQIDGDANDSVTALSAWTSTGTQDIGGTLYNQFELNDATLLINQDLMFSIV